VNIKIEIDIKINFLSYVFWLLKNIMLQILILM